MSDTQILFQELCSTYREYFTMFFHITMLYVTIIGAALHILITRILSKEFKQDIRIVSIVLVVAFVWVISGAYVWELSKASDETKQLEDNLENISALLSLNSSNKDRPEVHMPRLLSKVIGVMTKISWGIIILSVVGLVIWALFVIYREARKTSHTNIGSSEGNRGEKTPRKRRFWIRLGNK